MAFLSHSTQLTPEQAKAKGYEYRAFGTNKDGKTLYVWIDTKTNKPLIGSGGLQGDATGPHVQTWKDTLQTVGDAALLGTGVGAATLAGGGAAAGGAAGGSATGGGTAAVTAGSTAASTTPFWSKVAKVVSGASTAGKIINAGTSAAGAGAAGMAAGRDSEIQNTQRRDAIQADQYRQALLSALGMNLTDAHIDRPAGIPDTHLTGGLRPSALGQEGRDAAKVNYGLSMDHLKNLPSVTPGKLENTLGVIGMIGKGLESYNAQGQSNTTSELLRKLLARQQAEDTVAPTEDDGQ